MTALDIIVMLAAAVLAALVLYGWGTVTAWRQEQRDKKQPQFYTYEDDPARWMAEYREWKEERR